MCVSEHERQRAISFGLAPEHAVVVHNGIDLAQFPFRGLPSTRRQTGNSLRILYAGRLVETKGAHTAVEAIGWLRRNHPAVQVSLTLLGAGHDTYVQTLDRRIADDNLAQHVARQGWIPREQMPDFMGRFDVLVLPTIHPEPLARVAQEAMALGLNVIATSTGGTPEIVQRDQTGLLFRPGDPAELGACLLRLLSDISLCDQLAISALNMVREKFTIEAMGAQVEGHLLAWKAAQPNQTARFEGP
jgi:glycogen(starch) synthase